MSRLAATLRMIRFEHSVFALPFALSGAWLASGGTPPRLRDLLWIVTAAVAARSAAMAFNRLADRRLDAANPRTARRELPRGELTAAFVAGFTLICAAGFVAASFVLAPVCGWLSLPVLALLLGYSFLKRVTWLCHLGLGLALACAPAGAWLAVKKGFAPGWPQPLLLGAGVVAWVAGFDLLYALQDLEHDRGAGLRSFPARFGPRATRLAAMFLHAAAWSVFVLVGIQAGFGAAYFAGVALVGALLAFEHWLVRGGRTESIPVAFFQVNACVGLVYFAGVLIDGMQRLVEGST
ncbi:MAG: 4-hydroxybenzoate octaprenyltransferase [Planctomycetota bacterium]|nr:MAG: 4-hydroxybenzoate octaprenyltransferase [Planctomycetota bacterium]